ncbi:MAG: NAD-dependent epimerase/dehydratase family protein [Chitinivibrionales bacterium]|nr:NAD-dependent epimerase/dehydratase family protein [Chitinivibrionales bacterium]
MSTSNTALITGASGFVGKYLADLLVEQNYQVVGIDQSEKRIPNALDYYACDISDYESLCKILARTHPQLIFHLAAVSFLPAADLSPRIALNTNILGTAALLDAVKDVSPQSCILLIGSSKEYGSEVIAERVDENTPLRPTDFYGITKYAAEMAGLQYVRHFDLDIRFTRSFNHTGPGQPPRFVCSDWAKQIVEIAHTTKHGELLVGDIDAAIDFSDVRDVVAAYLAVVTRGRKGEVYNVSSGRATPLRYVLDKLIAVSRCAVTVRQDTTKLRAHKTSRRIAGDHSKLTGHTGWKPTIDIDRTLHDIYSWWDAELTTTPS